MKKMLKKYTIALVGILLVVGVVLIVSNPGGKSSGEESKEVNKTLEEIRTKQKRDTKSGVKEKNVKHIIVSEEILSSVDKKYIDEISKLAKTSKTEEGEFVLDTDYASERNEIKNYIVNAINQITKELADKGCTVSIDIDNGVLNVIYEGNADKDKEVLEIACLMGLHQRVSDNSSEWLVILYSTSYDSLGEMQSFVSDETIKSGEAIRKTSYRKIKPSETDATKDEKVTISPIEETEEVIH